MRKNSINKRILIIKTFHQNQLSIAVTMRKLRKIFERNNMKTKLSVYGAVNVIEKRGGWLYMTGTRMHHSLLQEPLKMVLLLIIVAKTINQLQTDAVLRRLGFKEQL